MSTTLLVAGGDGVAAVLALADGEAVCPDRPGPAHPRAVLVRSTEFMTFSCGRSQTKPAGKQARPGAAGKDDRLAGNRSHVRSPRPRRRRRRLDAAHGAFGQYGGALAPCGFGDCRRGLLRLGATVGGRVERSFDIEIGTGKEVARIRAAPIMRDSS